MVSQTGLRVVRSNFCKWPNISWKRTDHAQQCHHD